METVRSVLQNYHTLWPQTQGDERILIPTLLGGGDVYSSRLGEKIKQRTPPDLSRTSRIHYRLVLKEICSPLEEFKTADELVYAIMCALSGMLSFTTISADYRLTNITFHFKAHERAWKQCNLLHRDISASNILLYENPETGMVEGLLADWDLAKTREQLVKGSPTQPWRSVSVWSYILRKCVP